MFLLNNNILQSNIINICILIPILIKLWIDLATPKLTDRHKYILREIQNSEKELQQASLNLITEENQTKKLKTHLQTIKNNTKITIRNIELNAIHQGKEKIEMLTQEEKKCADMETLATKKQIYQHTANLVIQISEKNLKKILTCKKQSELINININQLDTLK
nr:ATP synthase CF0 B subunit [Cryptomonas paramecium]